MVEQRVILTHLQICFDQVVVLKNLCIRLKTCSHLINDIHLQTFFFQYLSIWIQISLFAIRVLHYMASACPCYLKYTTKIGFAKTCAFLQ